MGIRGLLPFISDCKDDINITNLKDKVFGIDAYIWLCKGAYCLPYQLANGIPASLHTDYFVKRIEHLLRLGTKFVLVFDGTSPKVKSGQ